MHELSADIVDLLRLFRAQREADRPKDRLDVAALEALHGRL